MTAPAVRFPLSTIGRPFCAGALLFCASVPGYAQRVTASDSQKPFVAMSASVHALRDSLVAIAKAQVGTRYVRGGQSPERGFDCSGLARYVMARMAVKLPRTARQQSTVGLAIGRDSRRLRPGDLLTFGKTERGVSHVGIYIGGGRYVHASSSAGRVIVSDLARTSSSLVRAWRGARRMVDGGAADSLRLADGS
jgi:cell wall-associated NlpC family hydrolase